MTWVRAQCGNLRVESMTWLVKNSSLHFSRGTGTRRVLEQRIGCVHRMGQVRGVQLVNFVAGGRSSELR